MRALAVWTILWVVPASSGAQVEMTTTEPRLAYWSMGESTGARTVVVAHGGPGVTHDYLVPEWQSLAATHRVVFYDQRGCGESEDGSGYGWREHVGDLRRLIHELSPGAPVVLAGSSWGAWLGLFYALEYPDDLAGLVLSGLRAPNVWLRPGGITATGPYGDIDDDRSVRERTAAVGALSERLVRCPAEGEETGASLQDAPDIWHLYELTLPVLFFPDNRFGRSFQEAAAAPDRESSFLTVVGGGHDPWFVSPAQFFQTVNEFLSELAGG